MLTVIGFQIGDVRNLVVTFESHLRPKTRRRRRGLVRCCESRSVKLKTIDFPDLKIPGSSTLWSHRAAALVTSGLALRYLEGEGAALILQM